MPELSSHLVVRLLRASDQASSAAAGRTGLIDLAMSPASRVGFILMSLLRIEGARLSDRRERELEAFRLQRDRYAALVADLRRACPSLYQIKGFHVQELYPPGVLRDSNDLDLVVPEREDMPPAVQLLRSRGFEPLLCGVDIVPDGRHAYHIGMRNAAFVSAEQPRPDYVELANYSLVGSHLVPPKFVDLRDLPNPVFANVLATLSERFEQPYRTRDLLDASLSLERLTSQDARDLACLVAELQLAPELAGLVRALRAAGLAPGADQLPTAPLREVARERARRARRRTRHLMLPQVTLSRWSAGERHDPLSRALRKLGTSRLFTPEPVEELLRRGLRGTGRPVGPQASAGIWLRGASAVTPAGSFGVSTRRDQVLAAATRVSVLRDHASTQLRS